MSEFESEFEEGMRTDWEYASKKIAQKYGLEGITDEFCAALKEFQYYGWDVKTIQDVFDIVTVDCEDLKDFEEEEYE